MTGILYLLPTVIDTETMESVPETTRRRTVSLRHLIVENARTTRRYLKAIDRDVDIDAIEFLEWDKHNPPKNWDAFLKPALAGHDMGLISEAGCPGIADPGQDIVAAAHRAGIRVAPLSGPSSIFMALMASGLNGQRFAFHGYLPIDDAPRRKELARLEKEARQFRQTQIFMETPYRNNALMKLMLQVLAPGTLLCVAANISSDREFIRTQPVAAWKKAAPDLHKQPAIFMIL